MKLSVIIVSYNCNKVLLQCLESIERYNDLGKDLEVIIVDNYERSDLSHEVFDHYILNIKYINSKKNNGFGAGNNLGVEYAKSDILFFLNPDTILLEPIFNNAYNSIVANNNHIQGFSLVDIYGNTNDSFSFMYDNFWLHQILLVLKRHRVDKILEFEFINKLIWPWGAAFALSKDAFIKAGKFDENIFLCNEEADLMNRIINRKVLISHQKIVHLEGNGVPVSINRVVEFFKSRDYYFDKYKVSMLDRSFWNIYTHFLAYRNKLYQKNESRQNFYKAYKKYYFEGSKL